NLEEPDRVPIFECSTSPKIIDLLIPDGAIEDLVEKYDLDSVYYREAYKYEPVDEERGYFRDEWGIVMKLENEVMPTPVKHPIQSEDDLNDFVAPDPRAPIRLARLKSAIHRFKGEKPIVLGMSDAFAIPWKLRGMADFLVDLAINPKFAKRLINIVVEYNCELVRFAAEQGVDIIRPTDDYAFNTGPFMSPAMWEEFFQPGLKKIVDVAHGLNLKVVKHSCGYLRGLVEPILETGIDALHPIQPFMEQSLENFKNKYGGKVCLMGNVDCINVLTTGTRDMVFEDVRRCLREGAINGGYMLASSNSFHSGTLPENFIAMVEANHEFGNYPLSI
ncbi:uroporphyrinogen decarboxylase family protein, partial [Thermodesulfobacteriota bacterium]